MAHILNEHFTIVPQAAVTYLKKKQHFTLIPDYRTRAMRGMVSLSMLAQEQLGALQLSGTGQFAYTSEEPLGDGEEVYLGQATIGGEIALAKYETFRPFLGALANYDVKRSVEAGDRFGWQTTAGARFALSSRVDFALSVYTGRKDEERTTGGNLFLKITF
jgi:hypothetical protein